MPQAGVIYCTLARNIRPSGANPIAVSLYGVRAALFLAVLSTGSESCTFRRSQSISVQYRFLTALGLLSVDLIQGHDIAADLCMLQALIGFGHPDMMTKADTWYCWMEGG